MAKKETSPELTEEFKQKLAMTKLLDMEVDEELKRSFLAYAMAVNKSRAIPDVRDGLKPVHRRILYSMHEMGLYNDKAYKKCARIVGDCMGKYHPHGDSSVYDALVRLAQDFTINVPLVDGQGNFGSVDGDGAAAMRYTEAKLSKIAAEMLRDLDKETVTDMALRKARINPKDVIRCSITRKSIEFPKINKFNFKLTDIPLISNR